MFTLLDFAIWSCLKRKDLVLHIPGLKSVRSTARWTGLWLQEHALLLGYHRIAREDWDPHHLCVSPDNFVEQMHVLQSVANPISLTDLVVLLAEGAPLRGRVVVTIDDGYEDTYSTATPILRRFRVPATVFVITGSIGLEFWWDRLTGWCREAKDFDRPLHISLDGQELDWRPRGSDEKEKRQDFAQRAGDFLRALAPADREEAMCILSAWFDSSVNSTTPVRGMTATEISALAADGLIEIGSHTKSHALLADLSVEEQRQEITCSKASLEEITGQPVMSFSYPHGSYSNKTPRIVRESGFACACTSAEGAAVKASDPFVLPRVWVPDLPGERFHHWLKRRL